MVCIYWRISITGGHGCWLAARRPVALRMLRYQQFATAATQRTLPMRQRPAVTDFSNGVAAQCS